MQTHGGLLPDLARTAGVIGETGNGGPAGHNVAYAHSVQTLKHVVQTSWQSERVQKAWVDYTYSAYSTQTNKFEPTRISSLDFNTPFIKNIPQKQDDIPLLLATGGDYVK